MLQEQNLLSEENVMRLEKGKRGLLNVLFGRTTVIILVLLAQVLLFFLATTWLGKDVSYFWGASVILAVFVVLNLLNRGDDPTVKLTWIILIMGMPVFGTLLYLWIHNDIGHRLLHGRLDRIIERTKGYLQEDHPKKEIFRESEPELYAVGCYLEKCGGFPIYDATKVKYFPSGEEKFADLLVELEKAKQYIFLEYFIIDEGYMWGRILDILSRKVKEGVEVRVLYDGTCAIYKLPYSYPKKLRELGIQCKMFAPIRPFVSTHYNNRDHRKILVIDGKVAYTGGVNLADEYINKRTLYGRWKDTAIKVEGEAVRSFLLMFLQMWNVDKEEETEYDIYLGSCEAKASASDGEVAIAKTAATPGPMGNGWIAPYGDSPLDGERVGEMVYYDILNHARRYVHIMTPYLILDNGMITALTFAAKRGVEVQLILPHIPDKKYAFALAKTHYKQLLEAGVQIFEYLPGFVHAKVFISDDERAVVGTINLDYRSLYHHFECGVYLHKVPEINRIEKDFISTRGECRQISLDDVKKEPLRRKVMGMLLKLVAPLM